MPIAVACACGKRFTVPDHFAGKTGKCTECGQPIVAPMPGTMSASGDQLETFSATPAAARPQPVAAGGMSVAKSVGGYALSKKLGGTVFLGTSPTGTTVAVKLLPPEITARSPTAGKRFLREARSLFGLTHPNVVACLDAGEELGTLFLVMEHFPGRTVRELLAEKGKLDETTALQIARQVARGLGHLEQHHLVHRNVKPEHILVDDAGRVKLVGLGLVKSDDEGESEEAAPLTLKGHLVGTPQYMAPEQATGTPTYSFSTDLFSLGITLYEMLAGAVPWNDANAMRVLSAIARDPPPPLRAKNPAVGESTVAIVEKLLAKSAGQRYATADALIADIAAIVGGDAPAPAAAARSAAAPAPAATGDAAVKRLTMLVIALSVIVVVLLGVVVALAMR